MKMTFNKTCIALGLCGLMLTGCESTRAKRIDPAGTQTITTIKRLDIYRKIYLKNIF